MKTLLAGYAVWWGAAAAVTLALDGTAQWVIWTLWVIASVGSFISDIRGQRAKSRAPATTAASSQSPPQSSPTAAPEPELEPEPEPPPWALSLLVDADEDAGVLRPTLQIGGPRAPRDAIVRLDVVDGRGDVRLTTERHFPHPDTGADLILGTLALPEGVSADEAAGWDWDAVLREGGDELVRQRGPLAGSGRLNDEAELDVPDVPVGQAVDRGTGELVDRQLRPPDVPALNVLAIMAFLLEGGEIVDLADDSIDRDAAGYLSETLARRCLALPIGWRDGKLLVAMADPGNSRAIDDLHVMTGHEIHPVAANRDAILRAIDRLAAEAA